MSYLSNVKREERAQRFDISQHSSDNRFEELHSERLAKRKHYKPPVPFIGTCLSMCPEYERYERELHFDVSIFEVMPEKGEDEGSGYAKIDHNRAVKKYHRPAAGNETPFPEDIRPPHVLKETLDYLIESILSLYPIQVDPHSKQELPYNFVDIHNFIRDRSRSIRQDLTIQHCRNPLSVHLHEVISRFHIYSIWEGFDEVETVNGGAFDSFQNWEQLRKVLQTLQECYDDYKNSVSEGGLQNESEFRSYYLLVHWNDDEIYRKTLNLPSFVLFSKHVQFALKVVKLAQSTDYIQFFSWIKNMDHIDNLYDQIVRFFQLCCISGEMFRSVRKNALAIISKAYSKVELFKYSELCRFLSVSEFDENDQTEMKNLLEYCKMNCKFDDKDTIVGMTFEKENAGNISELKCQQGNFKKPFSLVGKWLDGILSFKELMYPESYRVELPRTFSHSLESKAHNAIEPMNATNKQPVIRTNYIPEHFKEDLVCFLTNFLTQEVLVEQATLLVSQFYRQRQTLFSQESQKQQTAVVLYHLYNQILFDIFYTFTREIIAEKAESFNRQANQMVCIYVLNQVYEELLNTFTAQECKRLVLKQSKKEFKKRRTLCYLVKCCKYWIHSLRTKKRLLYNCEASDVLLNTKKEYNDLSLHQFYNKNVHIVLCYYPNINEPSMEYWVDMAIQCFDNKKIHIDKLPISANIDLFVKNDQIYLLIVYLSETLTRNLDKFSRLIMCMQLYKEKVKGPLFIQFNIPEHNEECFNETKQKIDSSIPFSWFFIRFEHIELKDTHNIGFLNLQFMNAVTWTLDSSKVLQTEEENVDNLNTLLYSSFMDDFIFLVGEFIQIHGPRISSLRDILSIYIEIYNHLIASFFENVVISIPKRKLLCYNLPEMNFGWKQDDFISVYTETLLLRGLISSVSYSMMMDQTEFLITKDIPWSKQSKMIVYMIESCYLMLCEKLKNEQISYLKSALAIWKSYFRQICQQRLKYWQLLLPQTKELIINNYDMSSKLINKKFRHNENCTPAEKETDWAIGLFKQSQNQETIRDSNEFMRDNLMANINVSIEKYREFQAYLSFKINKKK